MWWGASGLPLGHVPALEVTRLEIPPGRSRPGGERLSLALDRRWSPGRSPHCVLTPTGCWAGDGLAHPGQPEVQSRMQEERK